MASKIPQTEVQERDGSITPEQDSALSSSEEKQLSGPLDVDDYPDGGTRAWLVAISTSLIMFCTMGMMNTYGVFQAYYQTHQLADHSPSAISWIGSIQVFFMFSSGLVGGPLFDRYGAKIIRPGIIAYVFSYMMLSLCKVYWHFILVQGLLGGLSNGLTMAPAMAVTPQYFNKKRGAAMGITIAGSSIGGLILPIVLSKMLYSSLGFAWSMRVMGFIFLALLAFAGVIIRARLPPRTSKFFLPSAFKNKMYSMLILSAWFALMGVFVPIFYLPSYAQIHGMKPQLAAYLVAILNGASTFGRVIPGVLSDKLGRLNVFAVASLSSGILIFCWPEAKTNAAIIAFAAIYGFCSGGVISGMAVSLASCTANPKDFGTYLGMGMAIVSVSTLVSPPINGAFVQHYHSFNQAAYYSGAISIIGGMLAFATKLFVPGGFIAKS